MLPITNVSFYGSPGTIKDKFKNKRINTRVSANNKTTELLAKNETVAKTLPKKSKTKRILTTSLLTLGKPFF